MQVWYGMVSHLICHLSGPSHNRFALGQDYLIPGGALWRGDPSSIIPHTCDYAVSPPLHRKLAPLLLSISHTPTSSLPISSPSTLPLSSRLPPSASNNSRPRWSRLNPSLSLRPRRQCPHINPGRKRDAMRFHQRAVPDIHAGCCRARVA
jgi:hypothetical protein